MRCRPSQALFCLLKAFLVGSHMSQLQRGYEISLAGQWAIKCQGPPAVVVLANSLFPCLQLAHRVLSAGMLHDCLDLSLF